MKRSGAYLDCSGLTRPTTLTVKSWIPGSHSVFTLKICASICTYVLSRGCSPCGQFNICSTRHKRHDILEKQKWKKDAWVASSCNLSISHLHVITLKAIQYTWSPVRPIPFTSWWPTRLVGGTMTRNHPLFIDVYTLSIRRQIEWWWYLTKCPS